MRIGLVGAGVMAKMHLPGWQAAGARLTGIFSRRSEAAHTLAREYGIQVFPTYEALLDAVDIVDLCTPTHLHHPMAMQAFAAGKHVVCEKPVALTLEDASQMIAAAEAAGVRFFVAMVLRFFPQYQLALDMVNDGRVGEVRAMRLKRVAFPPPEEKDWYFDETRSGGMMVDLMLHDFDFARAVGGEVTRVYARADGNRYALATLRFADGAMALVEGGWANPPGVFRTGLDIAGSDGVIEWDSDATGTIRSFTGPPTGDGPREVGLPLSPLAEDPYTAQIVHAYRAIQKGERFLVTPKDALEALRIALAARKSARTGRVVSLKGE